ncbi:hypothetical protein PAMA_011791 [Pampus argenteus]
MQPKTGGLFSERLHLQWPFTSSHRFVERLKEANWNFLMDHFGPKRIVTRREFNDVECKSISGSRVMETGFPSGGMPTLMGAVTRYLFCLRLSRAAVRAIDKKGEKKGEGGVFTGVLQSEASFSCTQSSGLSAADRRSFIRDSVPRSQILSKTSRGHEDRQEILHSSVTGARFPMQLNLQRQRSPIVTWHKWRLVRLEAGEELRMSPFLLDLLA